MNDQYEVELAKQGRWSLIIRALLALALVLFVIVVLLNAGTILVSTFLTIFQIVFSLIIVACLALLLLVVLNRIGNAEARIKKDLEALRKTLLESLTRMVQTYSHFLPGSWLTLSKRQLLTIRGFIKSRSACFLP